MNQSTDRPASISRAPLAGVSALIVFGLLLSVSFSGKTAIGTESRRDPLSERATVRQVSAPVIKAARHLAGSDTHKPCARLAATAIIPIAERAASPACPADPIAPAPSLLRAEMLDLPPPAIA